METEETCLWHSQAHMPSVKAHEVVLLRGEGSYVWDARGRRLLDVPASLWYCNIGHGRAEIANAVADQMRQLETYSTFQRYATRPALELAARLASMTPVSNPKVFLTSGGGDSVDTAVKLVRRYWHAIGKPDKRIIVTREKAYHGLHGFGTSITGLDVNRDGLGELLGDTIRVPTHDVDALETLLRLKGDHIAAFVAEPVIGTGGVLNPLPDYLDRAQAACKDNEVTFIVDEVITGFGRTGDMFASERFELKPDMMLLAKGITSGYLPMGAVVIGQRYWEPFWRQDSELVFRHGLTYAGHASACAAAQANLDIIEREDLVTRVRDLEPVLESTLEKLADHPLVKDVRAGVGLLGGVQLHDASVADSIADFCLEKGLLMRVISDATLQVSPPFVIDDSEIELVGSVIAEGLEAAVSKESPALTS